MARISSEQARLHALFHLVSKTAPTFAQRGFTARKELVIGKNMEFYDVAYLYRDEPPVRVFEALSGENVVGLVNIAGSSFLGSTLLSINAIEINDLATRGDMLRGVLRRELGLSAAESPDDRFKPVVYSYPRYGLGMQLEEGEWVIADWRSGDVVRGRIQEMEDEDPIQGPSVWSFWDAYPQAGQIEQEWAAEDGFIRNLVERGLSVRFGNVGYSRELMMSLGVRELQDTLDAEFQQRPPMQRTTILPVAVLGQTSNVHCAPASLSMMYYYTYGKEISQNDVAEAMGLLPNGSTLSGQVRAFKALLGKDFDVELDRSPTWQEFYDSLDKGLPAKSGIRGHARVAVGVREDDYIDPLTGESRLTERLLCINDPEPIGEGSQVWENSRTAMLQDFIFIRRRTG